MCELILCTVLFRYSSASNMMSLSWDDELAAGAQLWASQCNFNHDTDRNVCRFAVGQNLYIGGQQGTPVSSWRDAIGEYSSLFKTKKNYDFLVQLYCMLDDGKLFL